MDISMYSRKILKSGFASFFISLMIIVTYFFLSNFKVGGEIVGSVTVFNVIFTCLFLAACCTAAFLYGRGSNKNGLMGLISVFILFFINAAAIALMDTLVQNPSSALPPFILLLIYIPFFIYATLIYPILPAAYGYTAIISMLVIPVIMILAVVGIWIVARKYNRAKQT